MGHFGALATCSPLPAVSVKALQFWDTLTNGMLTLTLAFMTLKCRTYKPGGSGHHIAYAEVLERFTWPLWTSQQSSVWKGAHLAVTAPSLSGGCKMDLWRLRLADMQSATGKQVWQWILDNPIVEINWKLRKVHDCNDQDEIWPTTIAA